MRNPIVLFFFFFINLYFPISPYLCMGIDFCIAFFYGNWKLLKSYSTYITICFALILLALASVGASINPEEQVLFKYVRTFIATVVLIVAAGGIKAAPHVMMNVISCVFLVHIIAIIAQIIYPPLSWIMAPYFNFDRDIDLVQSMQLRKLGLCGGYDAASMLVISSVLFFYYIFYYRSKYVFLALAVLSMAMTLFVSRTGMILAVGCMAYFAFISIKKRKTVRKAGFVMIFAFIFAVVNLLLPILMESNGLLFNVNMKSGTDVSYFTQDYSTANGSARGLVEEHLNVVDQLDFLQLFLGAGNSSRSDIGYVQMLFQVGLVGLILIILLHLKMFFRLRKMKTGNIDYEIIRAFCMTYLVVLFLFNYKILLLYSRGFYDFFLICFVYLNNYWKWSTQKELNIKVC